MSGLIYNRARPAGFGLLILILAAVCTLSCSSERNRIAVLWSDRPEFAFYVEYFNASQDQYIIQMEYTKSPAAKLGNTDVKPDIIAGSRIHNTSAVLHFEPLDKFLTDNPLLQNIFYPKLLDAGIIDENQYLLPVSFNAPFIIFAENHGDSLSGYFTISFDEMKELAEKFNTVSGGVYSRMGFSPTWDDNFLYLMAAFFDTSFAESSTLLWDEAALSGAMNFAYEWNQKSNSGVRAVEDFTSRYFVTPPDKLVQTGRILFTGMYSNDFFIMTDEERDKLGFRWLVENNKIHLGEDTVYMGLIKKSKPLKAAPSKAAEAFLFWFFDADTQADILERSRQKKLTESTFGISGGFSSLRPVTEQAFPRFYPALFGRIPPEDFFTPANPLSENWPELKNNVILPYLRESARQPDSEGIRPLGEKMGKKGIGE